MTKGSAWPNRRTGQGRVGSAQTQQFLGYMWQYVLARQGYDQRLGGCTRFSAMAAILVAWAPSAEQQWQQRAGRIGVSWLNTLAVPSRPLQTKILQRLCFWIHGLVVLAHGLDVSSTIRDQMSHASRLDLVAAFRCRIGWADIAWRALADAESSRARGTPIDSPDWWPDQFSRVSTLQGLPLNSRLTSRCIALQVAETATPCC